MQFSYIQAILENKRLNMSNGQSLILQSPA